MSAARQLRRRARGRAAIVRRAGFLTFEAALDGLARWRDELRAESRDLTALCAMLDCTDLPGVTATIVPRSFYCRPGVHPDILSALDSDDAPDDLRLLIYEGDESATSMLSHCLDEAQLIN